MAAARRLSSSRSSRFFVDSHVHPQTLAVLQTRAEPLQWTLVVGDPFTDLDSDGFFGALFQYPGTFGDVPDLRSPIAEVQKKGGLSIVAADPLALTLLTSPGEMGADMAVGSTQRFGVPMGFGGPHAAYFATRDAFKRSLPGRLVGISVDSHGDTAYPPVASNARAAHSTRKGDV